MWSLLQCVVSWIIDFYVYWLYFGWYWKFTWLLPPASDFCLHITIKCNFIRILHGIQHAAKVGDDITIHKNLNTIKCHKGTTTLVTEMGFNGFAGKRERKKREFLSILTALATDLRQKKIKNEVLNLKEHTGQFQAVLCALGAYLQTYPNCIHQSYFIRCLSMRMIVWPSSIWVNFLVTEQNWYI